MYFYILDGQNIPSAQFEREQITLQGLTAQFKISGEMARVSSIRTIADLVETASERGVKTLIACGDDETFNIMLAHLKGRDFVVGFIPMKDGCYLSKLLGIDNLLTAVKTIAARRIETLDLAKIDKHYFINQVEFGIASSKIKKMSLWQRLKTREFPSYKLSLRIDDSYNMDIDCLGGTVTNSRVTSSKNSAIANPTDGFLDLLVLEKLTKLDVIRFQSDIADGILENIPGTSVIKCKKVEFLAPRGFPITLSGKTFAKVPTAVTIFPKQMRMVVGRNRVF